MSSISPSSPYHIHYPWQRGELYTHPGEGGSITAVMADLHLIWTGAIQEKLGIHEKDFKVTCSNCCQDGTDFFLLILFVHIWQVIAAFVVLHRGTGAVLWSRPCTTETTWSASQRCSSKPWALQHALSSRYVSLGVRQVPGRIVLCFVWPLFQLNIFGLYREKDDRRATAEYLKFDRRISSSL